MMLEVAAYHECVGRGIMHLADQYRAKHPDAQKKWERYVAARGYAESVGGMLADALTGIPPRRENF